MDIVSHLVFAVKYKGINQHRGLISQSSTIITTPCDRCKYKYSHVNAESYINKLECSFLRNLLL